MNEHRKNRILEKLAEIKRYSTADVRGKGSYRELSRTNPRIGAPLVVKNYKKIKKQGPFPRDSWGDLASRFGIRGNRPDRGWPHQSTKGEFTAKAIRTDKPAGVNVARVKAVAAHFDRKDQNYYGWHQRTSRGVYRPSRQKWIDNLEKKFKSDESALRRSDAKSKSKATASGTGGYESKLHQMSLPLESADLKQSVSSESGGSSKAREKTLKALKKSTKAVSETSGSKPSKAESSSSKAEKSESSGSTPVKSESSSKDTSSSESSSESKAKKS